MKQKSKRTEQKPRKAGEFSADRIFKLMDEVNALVEWESFRETTISLRQKQDIRRYGTPLTHQAFREQMKGRIHSLTRAVFQDEGTYHYVLFMAERGELLRPDIDPAEFNRRKQLILEKLDEMRFEENPNEELWRFSYWGDLNEVTNVLEKGADVNSKNVDGNTALRFASARGYEEIVRLLISRGANVNVQDNRGWTPLMTTSFEGNIEIVELLISSGADVNLRDEDGNTALNIARHGEALGRGTETAELLRSHGAKELTLEERLLEKRGITMGGGNDHETKS